MTFRTEKFDLTLAESRRYFNFHIGNKLKSRAGNKSAAHCIFGGHAHGDRTMSMTVDFVKGVWKCHVCNMGGGIFDFEKQLTGKSNAECWDSIYAIIGRNNDNHRPAQPQAAPPRPNGQVTQEEPKQPKSRPHIFKTYDYNDETGLRYQEVRLEPRAFFFRRPDGKGGWINDLAGVERIPFNLPALRKATAAMKVTAAIITEGPKDAETVQRAATEFPDDGKVWLGITNSEGALNWTDEHSKYLAGVTEAYVTEDNDKAGRERTKQICPSIAMYVPDIRVVRFTELPEKGDVSDYLLDHTPDELYERMMSAPKWEPQVDGEDVQENEPEPPEAEAEPDTRTSAAPDEWPEPEELGDELPPVKEFDPDLLPDTLRPWCVDLAERMQVPLDLTGVTAIAATGAAIMRRARIQPKALDTEWTEYANFWGAVAADSGLMKSPVMDAMIAPLLRTEALWRVEYECEVANAKASKQVAELRERAWEQQYVAAAKKGISGDGLPIRPDDSISEPHQKRLIITDATFEKLHEIVAHNPAGIVCWRDELPGWLADLEKPERKSERQFYLSGWRGHTQHNIERIGRGSIFVPNLCVQVFGGIQPGPLRSYLSDVLKGGPTDDGLMPRFSLLTWPDFNGIWRYVDKLPNNTARQTAVDMFERLVKMDVEEGRCLKFGLAAQELFVEWLTAHQRKVLSPDTLPVMRSHLAKYRKLMPALSLALTLAEADTNIVPLKSAQRAAAWCDYLESHAYRLYASRLAPEMAAAQSLVRKLKDGWHGKEKGFFTLRDVYHPRWSGLTTKDEARAALFILIEYNWCRKVTNAQSKEGRPTELYAINPRIGGTK